MELDLMLGTLDKSSIFRVLTLLFEHGLVHAVEDGRGIVRYEFCTSKSNGHSHDSHSDLHAHFYCEECNRVFCFEKIPTPAVDVPEGFNIHSINFMIKGLCPECRGKRP